MCDELKELSETERLEQEIFSTVGVEYDSSLVQIARINLRIFLEEANEASIYLVKEKSFAFQTGYLRKAGRLIKELLFNTELGFYPKDALDQLASLAQQYIRKLIDDANVNLDKGTEEGVSIAVGQMIEIKKICDSKLFRIRGIAKPVGYAELVKRIPGEIKKYA